MGRRVPRQRGVGVYDKPPLGHAALVARMQDRGLIIPDVGLSERYVRSIGYYRLSPYMIPFRRAGSDNFRSSVYSIDLGRYEGLVCYYERLGFCFFAGMGKRILGALREVKNRLHYTMELGKVPRQRVILVRHDGDARAVNICLQPSFSWWESAGMTFPTGWANDDAVIAAAAELADALGEDPNHTVAAAAMDLDGNIYAGVNNYHFNGGPCAELVVMGMAASAQAGRLATMVAVGDGGRGVISPCGRCRQVMLDQHPDICILVPADDGIRSVSVRELLPYSYVQPDEDPRRFVRFSRRYLDDVVSGRKTRTIRYRDPVPLGETTLIFEDGEHLGFVTMPGVIESVTRIRLSDLDPDSRESLREHYPEMPEDPELAEVRFHI